MNRMARWAMSKAMAMRIWWCSGNRLVDRERQLGWTVVSNDGLGRFEPTQEVTLATASWDSHFSIMYLWGSDFDGDGLLDLVVAEGHIVEVWYKLGRRALIPPCNCSMSGSLAWPMATATADMDLLIEEFDDSAHLTPIPSEPVDQRRLRLCQQR